ncbi:MAG: hypothetical protein U9R08_05410 [Nanoarchaeota archaeon]|nr:hypothetical protein [Nanoarchaeota archaeon]
MKDFKPRFVPPILIKRANIPSLPAVCLIYNLANFEGGNGWKDRKLIAKTDKQIKYGFLKFSPQKSNFYKYLEELKEKGFIQNKEEPFEDKRNKIRHKKEYRLKKRNGRLLLRIIDLFHTLNSLKLRGAENLNFLLEFEKTDYYREDPFFTHKAIKKWSNFQIKQLEVEITNYKDQYNKTCEKLANIVPRGTRSDKELEKEIESMYIEPKRTKKQRRLSKK